MWVRGHSRSLKLVPFESLGAVSYSLFTVTMAVSIAVCEIFSVKKWPDLENQIRNRSRSWDMAPFDRSRTSSYSPSIVTMALSCIVCKIWRLIGRKLRNFYTPPVFSAPAGGWPRRNFVKMFDADKTRMIGLPYGGKTTTINVKPFSFNTGTSRMDRQTDGRTDRRTELLYQYRASVWWRAIKMHQLIFKTFTVCLS